jgi:hypothetical protein
MSDPGNRQFDVRHMPYEVRDFPQEWVRPGVVIRPLSGHRRGGRLGWMRSMSEGRISCGVLPVGTSARDFRLRAGRQRVVCGPAAEREGSISASSGRWLSDQTSLVSGPLARAPMLTDRSTWSMAPSARVSDPLTPAPASEGIRPGTAFRLEVVGSFLLREREGGVAR